MNKKVKELFGNKKFIRIFASCSSVVLAIICVMSIMLPSYFSWKGYYDTAIAERERRKYLQTLPLEALGVTAKLNEGVAYYDNGNALPKNSDFNVTVHFTEKGKEFDEILQPNDFQIDVPQNFSIDGGNVRITYTFTPSEDNSNVQSKTLTADVQCVLEDVAPVRIVVKNKPYRVYYSDEMTFDITGMDATVHYNDGHTEPVAEGELSSSAEKLVAGTQSAAVTWSRGGTVLPVEVPITVVPEANMTTGILRRFIPKDNVL